MFWLECLVLEIVDFWVMWDNFVLVGWDLGDVILWIGLFLFGIGWWLLLRLVYRLLCIRRFCVSWIVLVWNCWLLV